MTRQRWTSRTVFILLVKAIATRNYLLQQGITPERIIIQALDESKLKQPGNTIVEHTYNRRVEFKWQDLRGIDILFEEQDREQ